MSATETAARLEAFVRKQFGVPPDDPGFGSDTPLFERGYVDSIGVAELLAFVQATFGVAIPDEDLLSDEFDSINGIAGIVRRLRDGNGTGQSEHVDVTGQALDSGGSGATPTTPNYEDAR